MRTILSVVVGVFLLSGCGGKTEPTCGPMKEITTSSVVKVGDTYHLFTTEMVSDPMWVMRPFSADSDT